MGEQWFCAVKDARRGPRGGADRRHPRHDADARPDPGRLAHAVVRQPRFCTDMLTHPDVVRRWAIAVVLHGLWDADLFVYTYLKLLGRVVVGWYVVLAILKQALAEVEQARVAAAQA